MLPHSPHWSAGTPAVGAAPPQRQRTTGALEPSSGTAFGGAAPQDTIEPSSGSGVHHIAGTAAITASTNGAQTIELCPGKSTQVGADARTTTDDAPMIELAPGTSIADVSGGAAGDDTDGAVRNTTGSGEANNIAIGGRGQGRRGNRTTGSGEAIRIATGTEAAFAPIEPNAGTHKVGSSDGATGTAWMLQRRRGQGARGQAARQLPGSCANRDSDNGASRQAAGSPSTPTTGSATP